jgi:hypothetical protein
MRATAKVLLLASILALKPACGGGGGGGGGAGTGASMPALPALVAPAPAAASLPGTAFPALAPDLSGTVHNVDATVGMSDAVVQAAIQGFLNGGGRITFTTTAGGPRTIVLTSPLQLNAFSPAVIVDGNDLITLDGNLATRMFDLGYLSGLKVQRMKFVHGRASQSGGAIDAPNPIHLLTVINCSFDDCQTVEGGPDRGGGAIRAWGTDHTQISGCTFNKCAASNGGAVNSLGSWLTIIESTFTQNAAFGTGGGQDAGPGGQGGIGGAVYVDNVSNNAAPSYELVISGCVFNANIANDQAGAVFGYMTPYDAVTHPIHSTMIVDSSTFCGNVMLGSSGGAIYTLNETLTLTNSTFSGNTSSGNSGALRCDNSPSTVTNCTFTGNHASIGGAIGKFSGTLALQNVTVANNTSDTFAAGIFAPGGTVTVNKSIFADNTAVNLFNGWNTDRTFASGTGNIQWPTVSGPNTAGIPITTSVVAASDPKLGALAANGGPTYTRSLGLGSAAINALPTTGAPAADQRGNTRDANPDAGAFEN